MLFVKFKESSMFYRTILMVASKLQVGEFIFLNHYFFVVKCYIQ
jgi:hypothetical protein